MGAVLYHNFLCRHYTGMIYRYIVRCDTACLKNAVWQIYLFYTQKHRACLKNAFRQMYSTLSGKFVPKGYDMPNKGGVAGYVDRIWHKYHAKWGMQMSGMIFQTRSSTPSGQFLEFTFL